jgi:hypothetical protein
MSKFKEITRDGNLEQFGGNLSFFLEIVKIP